MLGKAAKTREMLFDQYKNQLNSKYIQLNQCTAVTGTYKFYQVASARVAAAAQASAEARLLQAFADGASIRAAQAVGLQRITAPPPISKLNIIALEDLQKSLGWLEDYSDVAAIEAAFKDY